MGGLAFCGCVGLLYQWEMVPFAPGSRTHPGRVEVVGHTPIARQGWILRLALLIAVS